MKMFCQDYYILRPFEYYIFFANLFLYVKYSLSELCEIWAFRSGKCWYYNLVGRDTMTFIT